MLPRGEAADRHANDLEASQPGGKGLSQVSPLGANAGVRCKIKKGYLQIARSSDALLVNRITGPFRAFRL
jgi:hypothetical protein